MGESYFFSDHYGRCAGRLHQLAEEARQHALPGHGRRPPVRDRHLLGATGSAIAPLAGGAQRHRQDAALVRHVRQRLGLLPGGVDARSDRSAGRRGVVPRGQRPLPPRRMGRRGRTLRHAAQEPSQEQVPEGRPPAGTAGEDADLPGPQVLGRAAERRPGNRRADAQAIPRPTRRRGTPRSRRPWR